MGAPTTACYIRLRVYNWDASSRVQIVTHYIKPSAAPSASARARHIATRLAKIVKSNQNIGRASKWLQRNHGIYGFIEAVEGVFVQSTERVL